MEFAMILADQVLVMFLLLLSGIVLYKIKMIQDDGAKQMTNVLLYLVAPFLIVDTYQMEYDPAIAQNMLYGFGLSILSILIGILVSLFAKIKGKSNVIPTERFAIVFTNCGFMGVPLVSAVFGSMGVLYCTTYLTMFNLFVWTYGLVLIQGKNRAEKKKNLFEFIKPFINPTMICIVLGIAMFFLRLRLPSPVGKAVSFLASMNTPLAMIISGVYIARSGLLSALKIPRIYLITILKCFIVPLVTLLVFQFLPLDTTLRTTILISSACPTAANTILFAGKFGGDEKRASHLFALTTLTSILSMPLIMLISNIIFTH